MFAQEQPLYAIGTRGYPWIEIDFPDDYQRALLEENISTSVHFLPVHLLTAYRDRLPGQAPLPVAERFADRR